MKKYLVSLIICILVLSGCSRNIDISEYMSIYFVEPTITENLEVTELKIDVAFDEDQFVIDNPKFDNSLLSDDLLESLEFTIDGVSLEDYDFSPSNFEIQLANPEVLENTGLTYKKAIEFDLNLAENQKLFNDAEQQIKNLNNKIEDISKLQKYVEAANELYDIYQDYNIELYVSESVFGDVYEYLDLKPKIYQAKIDEIINYNQSNTYFITERTGDKETPEGIEPEIYTSFIEKDFSVAAEFIQGSIALKRTFTVDGDSSHKVHEGYTAHIPVVYQKGKDGTYLTYNGNKYNGNDKLNLLLKQAKNDYKAADIELGTTFLEEQNFKYEIMESGGMMFEKEVMGNASDITIATMMDAQLSEFDMSFSYMAYTTAIPSIISNNYNVAVKLANGEFS